MFFLGRNFVSCLIVLKNQKTKTLKPKSLKTFFQKPRFFQAVHPTRGVLNRVGMKFGEIVQFVLQVNIHRLTESDFRFDVTLSRRRPYDVISHRKVLPPGECTRGVCSSVRQLLIRSRYVYTVHSMHKLYSFIK